jgi:hypothetical protein
MELSSDGGFILGGEEASSFANNMFIAKTDSIGNAIIGIENQQSNVPEFYLLHQNYPNPFNPHTAIRFDVVNGRDRSLLVIYDMLGREVTKLVNQSLPAGSYEVKWDARNFASGMYFYKLTVGEFTAVKKMVLVK